MTGYHYRLQREAEAALLTIKRAGQLARSAFGGLDQEALDLTVAHSVLNQVVQGTRCSFREQRAELWRTTCGSELTTARDPNVWMTFCPFCGGRLETPRWSGPHAY